MSFKIIEDHDNYFIFNSDIILWSFKNIYSEALIKINIYSLTLTHYNIYIYIYIYI